MGMTICEKILARAAKRGEVKPGDYVWADVDGTTVNSGSAYADLKEIEIERLFDPERVYVTEDHLAPPPSVDSANAAVALRRMVREYGVKNFFDYGRHGIMHELFPDHGFVSPGDLIAAVDSHSTSYGCFNVASCSINEESVFVLATGRIWLRVPATIRCELVGRLPGPEGFVVGKDVILYLAKRLGKGSAVYKAIEFCGPGLSSVSMSGRFSMSNMSAEFGAKFSVFPYDQQTRDYLEGKLKRPARPVEPDVDASYEMRFMLDLNGMTPQVSLPHDPSNSVPIDVLETEKIKVQQAFIGSCTNGRMEDFRMASRILKGRKIHTDVRLIATPASQSIWRQCLEEGIWEIFAEAGALVTHSTCGACAGIQLGVLGDGETCISASARNYPGRMGSAKSAVYLANPATVAASALTGVITDPRRYL